MTPRVEILYLQGCPNHEATRELVERVAGDLRLEASIELVEVPDEAAAARLRFLGSPTVLVEGRDVEPDAGTRREVALSCRVYRTALGSTGLPDEHWIRRALVEAGGERRAVRRTGA